ncbi:prohead core scaffolding protein and protease [uncultured Caudovirales phage]|uniref:Prohead core scaffolding protein and protease n=1 Tax=uncultured Caudovirales phage TaxID=2100421 RepID=A0A6J5M0Q2_9CAUD|nr:prohead core scaffolding protein and protease [uncultured Caudovirales phage]
MKQVLIETIPFTVSPQQLHEGVKAPSGNPLVEGILATAKVKNGNGRYYSKELWQREIDKYMSCVRENRATGELDHPDSSIISLKNVSHIIRDIRWDGDKVIGKIEILPTVSGNILKALIDNNVMVGVSSRGMGSLKPLGEGTMEVQDDFELLCWDFVSTPSNPGSYMNLVKEGIEHKQSSYMKVNSILTDILCANGTCPII